MNKKYIETILSPKPYFLDDTSSEYNSSAVKQRGYLYMYQNKLIYCKALLAINIIGCNKRVNWEIWVEFPKDKFIYMTENLDPSQNIIRGKIFYELFFYHEPAGLEINLIFKMSKQITYPEIEILKSKSILYKDFKYGMELEDFNRLQSMLSH